MIQFLFAEYSFHSMMMSEMGDATEMGPPYTKRNLRIVHICIFLCCFSVVGLHIKLQPTIYIRVYSFLRKFYHIKEFSILLKPKENVFASYNFF